MWDLFLNMHEKCLTSNIIPVLKIINFSKKTYTLRKMLVNAVTNVATRQYPVNLFLEHTTQKRNHLPC